MFFFESLIKFNLQFYSQLCLEMELCGISIVGTGSKKSSGIEKVDWSNSLIAILIIDGARENSPSRIKTCKWAETKGKTDCQKEGSVNELLRTTTIPSLSLLLVLWQTGSGLIT